MNLVLSEHEVKRIKFCAWPGGVPPQDRDALMHVDRLLLMTHGVNQFLRPLSVADAPEGEAIGHDIEQARREFFACAARANAVHVIEVEPGLRFRLGRTLPASFDQSRDGWFWIEEA
jgi:hypothetical protein